MIFDWRDGRMILPPHVAEEGERVVITAPTEEEARKAAKAKIERMRRRGQQVKLAPAGMSRHKSDEPVTAKMSLSFSSTLRARVAAKIALGAFSLVLPEDWLDTDAAKLLQSWLWDEKPKTPEGEVIFAAPKRVPPPIDSFGRPPLHTLFFLPAGKSAMFGIVLFGEELMMTATGPLDSPAPEVAWQIDPILRTYEETSFWDLAIKARDTYPTAYENFARTSR
ncbi:MAG: hypothetical protein ACTHKT_06890 [Solirubrobacterales bacterium]